MQFKGNFGTVIPALPYYLAALTFEGDELIDVSFEPSVNSPGWDEYASRAAEIRGLRGVAASASRQGRLDFQKAVNPEPEDAGHERHRSNLGSLCHLCLL